MNGSPLLTTLGVGSPVLTTIGENSWATIGVAISKTNAQNRSLYRISATFKMSRFLPPTIIKKGVTVNGYAISPSTEFLGGAKAPPGNHSEMSLIVFVFSKRISVIC